MNLRTKIIVGIGALAVSLAATAQIWGPVVGGLVNGGVVFGSGGIVAQDATKLFWDNTNKRLGIGNAAPTVPLDVTGAATFSGAVSTGALTFSSLVSNVPVANLNSGTSASASTFWRGDGTWAAPAVSAPGSGRVTLTSASPTTTSTSLVDLTGATLTFTTGANPVTCGFTASTYNSVLGSSVTFNLMIDAALQLGTSGLQLYQPVNGYDMNSSFTFQSAALSAASHTFKIQWKVNANTGTLNATSANPAHFWCNEVK